jgi:hypothetical protein
LTADEGAQLLADARDLAERVVWREESKNDVLPTEEFIATLLEKGGGRFERVNLSLQMFLLCPVVGWIVKAARFREIDVRLESRL